MFCEKADFINKTDRKFIFFLLLFSPYRAIILRKTHLRLFRVPAEGSMIPGPHEKEDAGRV